MATTAVIPTYVVDGSLAVAGVKLPTYVTGQLTIASLVLPPYSVGSYKTSGNLPSYSTNALSFSLVSSGGLTVGGLADVYGDPYIPVGGVRLGGASLVLSISVIYDPFYPRGGITIGGAAPNGYYTIGGIIIGGSANNDFIPPVIPTGGAVLGGIAVVAEHIPYIAVGGINAGGTSGTSDIYTINISGGVAVSGQAALQFVGAVVGSGGALISGAAGIYDKYPVHNPKGGVSVSGAALAFAVPAGGVVTTENPYNDIFECWAINYETNAASRYERLPANSMCRIDGVTYVANAGGIYALDADDDAGQEIEASISFGDTDFGERNNKRVSNVYFGLRSEAKMRLKIITDKKSAYYYDIIPATFGEHGSRLTPAKGLDGLFWGFRLDNHAGADFELDAVSMDLAISDRMGR